MNIDISWGSLASGNWCRLTKTSVNTPNFKLYRLNKLPLPDHPYKRTYESRYSPKVQTYNGPMNEWDAQGSITNLGAIQYGITTLINSNRVSRGTDSLLQECSNKLSRKLYTRPVDLTVALGERKETARLLTDAAKRLGKTFLALRKGNFGGAARQLFGTYNNKLRKQLLNVTDPAKAWLCMQYGVKPLLQDIYGSIEVIQNVRPPQVCIRAKVEEVFDFEGQSGTAKDGRYVEISGYNSVRMKLVADVTNPFMDALNQIGFTNPINTAWELIPFSFVVDRFVLVGDWLTSMGPLPGLSNLKVYTTSGGDIRVTSATNFSYRTGWHTRGEYKGTLRQRAISKGPPIVYVNQTDIGQAKELIPSALAFLHLQATAFFNKEYLTHTGRTRPVRY